MLNEIFGTKWFVILQVHFFALLSRKVKGQNWKAASHHINDRSVDFVLVGKESYRIICAIELDDSTHDKVNRRERDNKIERIFNEAKIPPVRIGKFELAKEQIHETPNIYLPTLPKRLCLVFLNLCNNFKSIAVQSSAPFEIREGVTPHILCADSAPQ
ncbi:DUF2726 domain-containing protein [Candidatus Saccharibacteria bacterium]|nr:DUF2726 domain-containing protein [Candidatus Saccharibacteria bacterium]